MDVAVGVDKLEGTCRSRIAIDGWTIVLYFALFAWFGSLLPRFLEAATLPESIPIVNALGSDVNLEQAEAEISRKLKRSVTWVSYDPRLIDLARWAVPPDKQATCADIEHKIEMVLKAENKANMLSDPISGLLAVAQDQMTDLETDKSFQTLGLVKQSLECGFGPATTSSLATLFFLEGVAHFYAMDGAHESSFFNVISVDPDFILPKGYSPKVQKAFSELQRQHAFKRSVRLGISGLNATLYVDGKKIEEELRLFPGHHLAQLDGPTGSVRREWVLIGDQGTPTQLAQITSFGLLSPDQARALLNEKLETGTLDSGFVTILSHYLRIASLSELRFAFSGPAPNQLRIMTFREGSDLKVETVLVAPVVHKPTPAFLALVHLDAQRQFPGPNLTLYDLTRAGVGVQLEWRHKAVAFDIYAQVLPYSSRNSEDNDECTDSDATFVLPECTEVQTQVGGAGAVRYLVPLGSTFEFSPAVSLGGRTFYNVISSDGEALYSNEGLLFDAAFRLRLLWLQPQKPYLAVGLEAYGDLSLFPAAGLDSVGRIIPLGGSLALGLRF